MVDSFACARARVRGGLGRAMNMGKIRIRRACTVYEKPRPARQVLAEALGISTDQAGEAMLALIKAGYGIAPMNPTNGMLRDGMEATTPPSGHEQVITAIGKLRIRWQAMLRQGTEMALSRKYLDGGQDENSD